VAQQHRYGTFSAALGWLVPDTAGCPRAIAGSEQSHLGQRVSVFLALGVQLLEEFLLDFGWRVVVGREIAVVEEPVLFHHRLISNPPPIILSKAIDLILFRVNFVGNLDARERFLVA
jgi:hypothetical protein